MWQQALRNCFDLHDCRTWLVLMVLCLSGLPSALAQGGPPMLTDDPGTPGPGVWEILFSYQEHRTEQARLRDLPRIDFNYGLGDRIQLKFETSWLLSTGPDGGGVKSGLDNSLIGVKWRFLDEDRHGLEMSVYPQLELKNSAGSVARGIAEPGPNLFLPVEVGHSFGKIKVAGEAGYQYFHAGDNESVVGVLGAIEVSEKLELMAELRSYSTNFLSGGDVIGNVGFRQEMGNKLMLIGSIGTGLSNRADSTTFITYIGVQWFLGQKNKE